MHSILKELWHGNIATNATGKPMSKRTHSILKDLSSQCDKLQALLTRQQLEHFKKYDQTYSDLLAISEEEVFIFGFQLGAQIAFESISFEIADE